MICRVFNFDMIPIAQSELRPSFPHHLFIFIYEGLLSYSISIGFIEVAFVLVFLPADCRDIAVRNIISNFFLSLILCQAWELNLPIGLRRLHRKLNFINLGFLKKVYDYGSTK